MRQGFLLPHPHQLNPSQNLGELIPIALLIYQDYHRPHRSDQFPVINPKIRQWQLIWHGPLLILFAQECQHTFKQPQDFLFLMHRHHLPLFGRFRIWGIVIIYH